jgi:hypothetical protein
MQRLIEQFKNLNMRDPGAWPPLPVEHVAAEQHPG